MSKKTKKTFFDTLHAVIEKGIVRIAETDDYVLSSDEKAIARHMKRKGVSYNKVKFLNAVVL
jgi:hypothetical protein